MLSVSVGTRTTGDTYHDEIFSQPDRFGVAKCGRMTSGIALQLSSGNLTTEVMVL
ncbi:hypothetical protein Z945_1312 [Sulfitobacter noctilucae]|nr:hypothetical protein Z945_1312 [Sulfitobacter noctilucae]